MRWANTQKQIELLDEALSIARELGDKDPGYKRKVLGVLGRCRAALGQYELMFLCHTDKRDIAQDLNGSAFQCFTRCLQQWI